MPPKSADIAEDLRTRIASGEYPAGSTLPGYRELAAHYGAGQATISSALDVLQAEGLVRPVLKKGILVRKPGERRVIRRGQLVTRDPARGYVFPAATGPDEPWTVHGRPKRATVPVPDRVAVLLDVEPGSDVLRRRRVTSPEGEAPFQLVDTWISPAAVVDAPKVAERATGPGGYLDRLEEAGHGPMSWTETLRARMPTREEAKLLEIPTALPVLEITRVGTSARTGRPVEVTVCVIPSDRVDVVSELRRDETARWTGEGK